MEKVNLSIDNIYHLYKFGSKEKCLEEIEALRNMVLKNTKETVGYQLGEEFYVSLLGILTSEVSEFEAKKITNLQLLMSVIYCLRNSFNNSSFNQTLFCRNSNLIQSLVKTLKILLNSDSKDDSRIICNLSEKQLPEALIACLTCFSNMMAGNFEARSNVWSQLKPYYMDILSSPSIDVAHVGCAVTHQFLLEKNIKMEISEVELCAMLSKMLDLYTHEGVHSSFVLIPLKKLLGDTKLLLLSIWESLSSGPCLMALDILIDGLQSTSQEKEIVVEVVIFFVEKFKKDADKMLNTRDQNSQLVDPMVIARLLTFICSAASSDTFSKGLQMDQSLFVTTLVLLKEATCKGDRSENEFSRVVDKSSNRLDPIIETAPDPVFCFKSELIRLIAALVYRNKSNQELVREMKGIELLLENSQYDARNPFIREGCIFALWNLLEGNVDNQNYVRSFSIKGPANNPTLQGLGIDVVIQDGKLLLQQIVK